jgi:hypothetical protein
MQQYSVEITHVSHRYAQDLQGRRDLSLLAGDWFVPTRLSDPFAIRRTVSPCAQQGCGVYPVSSYLGIRGRWSFTVFFFNISFTAGIYFRR